MLPRPCRAPIPLIEEPKMSDQTNTPAQDENHLIAERRQKLAEWRATGKAYPNDFSRENTAGKLDEVYGEKTAEELEAMPVACDDMLFMEQGARGGMAVVHLWRYAERVLAQLGRVQMSCHSREANNAGRLARFVGGQITHTGFSKRIGCGQERAQRAGKD